MIVRSCEHDFPHVSGQESRSQMVVSSTYHPGGPIQLSHEVGSIGHSDSLCAVSFDYCFVYKM